MKDLKQFFAFLNDVNFPYVVLRNFDHLPYNVELGHHSDLDLLVYDLDHFLEIIPEATPEFPRPRIRFKLPVDDNFIYIDARHIGDGYYPTQFEKNILATREFWPEKGIWTPNYLHHQLGLAYHAVHHKGGIAPEYRRFLGDAELKDLLQALKESPIGWVEPKDPSVGKFNSYWKGATSSVEKKDGQVHKRQNGFLDFDLIKNEGNILLEFKNAKHVPHVSGILVEGNTLVMEDCGEPLSADNLPENWQDQMVEILSELHDAGVQHRDIRPDNFAIKDGHIKLIDFGWAVKPGISAPEIIENAPSVLGFPFKPSTGFDDAFSMRGVIKHFDFLLEEKELKK